MSGLGAELRDEIARARVCLTARLEAQANAEGLWEGELSSSALATSVAIAAFAVVDRERHAEVIARGARWLRAHVNADGGFGDSPESRSNLSTTTLAWSALRLAGGDDADTCAVSHGAEEWIGRYVGNLQPRVLADALATCYGVDRTFSAPILTVAALAGVLGPSPECWRLVPRLPFELAALPTSLFAWLRLPVVSYALPALIAIGLVRHRLAASENAVLRSLRNAVTPRALAKLEEIQPEDGGFLEAAPLTAFVALSLGACGLGDSLVLRRSEAFLLRGQRADGSWPIDTNLTTWLTTSAVKALAASGQVWSETRRRTIVAWLLGQQHSRRHPYTQAAPGGFAWTDRSGGVPDADDTAGALLALSHLDPRDVATREAAQRAIAWLVTLQNSDGGVPTFCRGWGRLPFDRSCPDITAHALAAVAAWSQALDGPLVRRALHFTRRARRYLSRVQRPDGTWWPLWFGNQWQPDGVNAVYGTAQVIVALTALGDRDADLDERLTRAIQYLKRAQNADGGWGRDACGRSTVEETGLALSALAGHADSGADMETLVRGARWLTRRVRSSELAPAPIGLYFSSLWYSEKLYPLIFALAGLGRLLAACPATRSAPPSMDEAFDRAGGRVTPREVRVA